MKRIVQVMESMCRQDVARDWVAQTSPATSSRVWSWGGGSADETSTVF